MTFMHIGVFFIAIAFALVSIFIAKYLLRVSGIIETVGLTVSGVEARLDRTIVELEQTIVETKDTATDVEEKLLALNSLFYTAKNIGDSTALLSEELAGRTERYAVDPSLPGIKPFVRTIQLSEFVSTLFGFWNRGKKA